MSDAKLPPISKGGYMKMMRERQGLRLKDVAERTGLSVSYMSDIERNITTPTLNTAAKIAAALDMNLSEWLDRAVQSMTTDEHQLLDAWRSGDWSRLLQMVSAKIAEEYEQ